MSTESKKLHTSLNGLDALDHMRGLKGSFQDSLHHDARIAHEMLAAFSALDSAKSYVAIKPVGSRKSEDHVVVPRDLWERIIAPFLEA